MAGYGNDSDAAHQDWYGDEFARRERGGPESGGDRGDHYGRRHRGADDRSSDDRDPLPRRGDSRGPRSRGPGRGSRQPARRGGRRGGRSLARRILLYSGVGILSLGLIAAGCGWYYYQHLTSNIHTFSTQGITDRPTEIQKDAFGGKPENILLIGSDSRAGGNSQVAGGKVNGARSDTSILLHIYGDRKHVVGVSIPRDTIVQLPSCDLGNGKQSRSSLDKFNAAFATGDLPGGNPDCEIHTIEQWTGIRVDHAVIIDFAGFAAMTNAVDGVDVCVPANITERDVNPNLKYPGKVLIPKGTSVKVSGQLALDYVRVREGLGDGSDIGRTRRQQAFLSSLIRKMQSAGIGQLPSLLEAVTKSITVDEDLKSNLLGFAQDMSGIDMHNVTFITMPGKYNPKGTPGDPNGEGVSPTAAAGVLWQRIRDSQLLDGTTAAQTDPTVPPTTTTTAPTRTGPPPIAPATIRVRVLNGTSGKGLAGAVSARLKSEGYDVVDTGNAPDAAVTTIAYGTGGLAAAQQLQKEFPGAKLVAASGSVLTVTLGADQAGNGTGTPGGPSSSTPPPLPTGVTANARTADQDLCSNITSGF